MRALPCALLAAVLCVGITACNRDATAQKEKAAPLNKGNAPPAAPTPTAPSPVDTSVPNPNARERA